MRPRDLDTLELPKLLDALAEFAASSSGAKRCQQLSPMTDLARVEHSLATLGEYMRLSLVQPQAPRTDVPDLRPLLALAAHDGAILDGSELAAVLTALRLATAVRRYLRSAGPDATCLNSLAARLVCPAGMENALAAAIDDTGRIREEATPALAAIRASIRSLREDIEQRLTRLLAEADPDVATEHYVTLRNDRFVIPVRTSAAHRIEGVIQDRSGSGETVFLEPLFAVERNNRLVLARKEEEAEERRVCAALTSEIRREQDVITGTFEALVECDVLAARAALAHRLDATIPTIGAGEIRLCRSRHPLLVLGGRPVTPVDLILPEGCRGLVITGPNTGGKTVALKTIGLLGLMAQCGLAIPADDSSALPCFASVYADIGDAQSIERNLSTFSSHMENLAEIARRADDRCLILLDEPGVGTDPAEGAALAVGLLAYLRDRGPFLGASSHCADVKTFALAEAAFDVAAVDVDSTTGEPRYQLRYHTLGKSLAIPMARRLKVPEAILTRAEQQLSGAIGPDVALAAERLDTTRHAYEARLREVETELDALTASRSEQAALVADLKAKQQEAWQEAIVEAREFVRGLRAEGRKVLEELRLSRAPSKTLEAATAAQEATIAAASAKHAAEPDVWEMPALGDEVEVTGQGIRGELVELKGTRARIRRGSLRFEVPAAGLRRVAPATGGRQKSGYPTHGPTMREIRLPEAPEAAEEISLLGLRVPEALRQLEEFLDRAVRSGRSSVRIIHGVGTGALLRAVRDFLDASPYCATFREGHPSEGGAGVAVAELEN